MEKKIKEILKLHKLWIESHNEKGERANLSDADLRNADLRDANLSNANLSNANLSNADLSDANLWNANLRDADLRDANLRDANLRDANLRDANLSDADLWGLKCSSVPIYFNCFQYFIFAFIGKNENGKGKMFLKIGYEEHHIEEWDKLLKSDHFDNEKEFKSLFLPHYKAIKKTLSHQLKSIK